MLETLDDAPRVFEAADVWIEAGDWFVWQLVGGPGRRAAAIDVPGRLQRHVERDRRLPVGGVPARRASEVCERRARQDARTTPRARPHRRDV